MRGGQPAAERELGVGAVDPCDVRVGDERHRPVARNEVAEQLEQADARGDASGSEHDVVGVAGGRVCSLPVDGRPLVVEALELLRSVRKRPVRLACALPGESGLDLEQDRERAGLEQRAGALRKDCAAPQRDHRGVACLEQRLHDLFLHRAERGLARLEELDDRLARAVLDLVVGVDELPAEPERDLLSDRRLAGAHEPDQGEVSV